MYEWRMLSKELQNQILTNRKKNLRPWHSPPHFESDGAASFHMSAACYEHNDILGSSLSRIEGFETALLGILSTDHCSLFAWCILPNHWHALIRPDSLSEILGEVGRLHGKTSYVWNKEDDMQGRKCWFRCADRRIRSSRHFHVARNYIHNNAVKHGYVDKWEDWPFSSARAYISEKGRDTVVREWEEYPILDMGNGWDD